MPSRADRRAYRPGVSALEPRQLLAARPLAARPIGGRTTFTIAGLSHSEYSASRHGSEAMVEVYHTPADKPTRFRLIVEGAPDGAPIEPIAVTLAAGEINRKVAIPIGAPAPGAGDRDMTVRLEVDEPGRDVRLNTTTATLHLLDRADATAPEVESVHLTAQGVVLTFSEPMDPARAADPASYDLTLMSRHKSFRPFDLAKNLTLSVSVPQLSPLRVKSVSYDPDQRTVTIVPSRRVDPNGAVGVASRFGRTTSRLRPSRAQPEPAGPLTDLAGNPMDGSFFLFAYPKSRMIPATPAGLHPA